MATVDTMTDKKQLLQESSTNAHSITCGRYRLIIRNQPLIMGVLNATPDSFSDGGQFHDVEKAVHHAVSMQNQGADIIDLGGQSTRPGSRTIDLDEELSRVIPVLRKLVKILKVPISVDTSRAEVAHQAVQLGAAIINDVTALRGDAQMLSVVANSRAAVILMHMQGSPSTMQMHPRYHNVVEDVLRFLAKAAERVQAAGVNQRRILIDPGLGFGKTLKHNLQIMAELNHLKQLGYPLVIGPSKKAFIGKTLNVPIKDRLVGTLACVAHSFHEGVSIVRVHDVKPAKDLLKMLSVIRNSQMQTKAQQ